MNKLPLSAGTCSYTNHPLGLKQCGEPAVAEIVRKPNGARVSLRCKTHLPNLASSDLFESHLISSDKG